MTTETSTDGMVIANEGKYAVCVNKEDGFYGCLFAKHPDGNFVSVRRCYPQELEKAEAHHRHESYIYKLFKSHIDTETEQP